MTLAERPERPGAGLRPDYVLDLYRPAKAWKLIPLGRPADPLVFGPPCE